MNTYSTYNALCKDHEIFILFWVCLFKRSRTKINDKERSGQPSVVNICHACLFGHFFLTQSRTTFFLNDEGLEIFEMIIITRPRKLTFNGDRRGPHYRLKSVLFKILTRRTK